MLNQRIILLMLRHLGLSCDIVVNGREAVEAVTLLPYGLILMDIEMPLMNGLDATRKIRASNAIHNRPTIVAVTASQIGEKACRQAGMDGLITKPLQIKILREILLELRYLGETTEAPSSTLKIEPFKYALSGKFSRMG
jgi:CheY-like chemotaxis protein